jgi:hypothetical protein
MPRDLHQENGSLLKATYDSVVLVGDLRSESLTLNCEKVTIGPQQSRVHDFVQCHGVLPLSQLHLYLPPQTILVFTIVPHAFHLCETSE